MRLKVYFNTDSQRKDIEYTLGWWDHYDTYGSDIRWDRWDKDETYYIIYGSAVCMQMAKKLKEKAQKVEVGEFRLI